MLPRLKGSRKKISTCHNFSTSVLELQQCTGRPCVCPSHSSASNRCSNSASFPPSQVSSGRANCSYSSPARIVVMVTRVTPPPAPETAQYRHPRYPPIPPPRFG